MKRALPWLLFLGIFAVYAWTAYPTVAPRDSADLAVAALTASPAHPPGYPLYALLGKAWISLIPWGDPAYRLNLLSAAGGAGCVAAVFLPFSPEAANAAGRKIPHYGKYSYLAFSGGNNRVKGTWAAADSPAVHRFVGGNP